jgi:hypothetical protein
MTTNSESAVSWGAVIAGAVGAAALSLVLLLLGTGLGLAVVSPWAGDGISGTAASVSTILWVTFVQLAAAVLGGYLAGRLRTRWVTVHTNEVYFRDTAHGFLAWAVATLLMASLLASAAGTALSGGFKAVTAGAEGEANPASYFVDSLFRGSDASATSARSAEVARILADGIKSGELSETDQDYLAKLVARQTGVASAEAEQRVSETFTALKKNLDDARKASAGVALWLVISLLVGAFVASFAATFGGRLRDSSVLVKA